MSLNNQVLDLDARQILIKRGNALVSQSYIGPSGEITLDTTLNTIRVHDGVTPGGTIIPTVSNVIAQVTAAITTVSANTIPDLVDLAVGPIGSDVANVTATVDELLGNPPLTLDSLEKLALAINNNPTFSSNINTIINGIRANIAEEILRATISEEGIQDALTVEIADRLTANAVIVGINGGNGGRYS